LSAAFDDLFGKNRLSFKRLLDACGSDETANWQNELAKKLKPSRIQIGKNTKVAPPNREQTIPSPLALFLAATDF